MKVTRKIVEKTETSSESDSFSIHDSSSDDLSDDVDESVFNEVCFTDLFVNEYIVVKFCTKKSDVHYDAQIKQKAYSDLQVSFMRKKGSKFYFPVNEDISTIEIGDVVRKLPTPSNMKGTERTQSLISFRFDHNQFNFR